MVPPVSSKLWMVFRGGYEYVFTDGEAAMLTVTLSTTAITDFHRHNVHADELATHAAEWAIGTHRANGAVDLGEANDLTRAQPGPLRIRRRSLAGNRGSGT